MRKREEIEKDEKGSIPYEKLILEVLLDIRNQNELIIDHVKNKK